MIAGPRRPLGSFVSLSHSHKSHTNMENAAVKPETAQATEAPKDMIEVTVVNQEGTEVTFKIRTTSRLERLMRTFADRIGQHFEAVRFLFDGQRINQDQTPQSLGMENGDQIECVCLRVP